MHHTCRHLSSGAFVLSDILAFRTFRGLAGRLASPPWPATALGRSASSTTARSPPSSSTARRSATPSTARPRRRLSDAFRAFDADEAPASPCSTAPAAPSAPAPTSRRSATERGNRVDARRRRADGADADAAGQAGDRRDRGVRGRRRPRARDLVRSPRGRCGRDARRLLPALGRAAHRRRHGPAAAARRHRPRARPDPHRAARSRRRGARDGPGRPRRAAPARPARRPSSWPTSSAELPQECLRQDRLSLLEQEGLEEEAAMRNELRHGLVSLQAGALEGAARFASGAGRHGGRLLREPARPGAPRASPAAVVEADGDQAAGSLAVVDVPALLEAHHPDGASLGADQGRRDVLAVGEPRDGAPVVGTARATTRS